MDSIKQLQEETINHACNNWKISDQAWLCIWSTVQFKLRIKYEDLEARQRSGLDSLLNRSWFRRVLSLQEVANARADIVACGTMSVSARIFTLIPSLVGINPDPHCQAVLDMMPGLSRKESWWSQMRDLRTLLLKFAKSEASDQRDIIYALLSISSDACAINFLQADYS